MTIEVQRASRQSVCGPVSERAINIDNKWVSVALECEEHDHANLSVPVAFER